MLSSQQVQRDKNLKKSITRDERAQYVENQSRAWHNACSLVCLGIKDLGSSSRVSGKKLASRLRDV
jgi:hypothetical protein